MDVVTQDDAFDVIEQAGGPSVSGCEPHSPTRMNQRNARIADT